MRPPTLTEQFIAMRDEHRKEINDLDWAASQPRGEHRYFIGDVMRFKAGGYGQIDKVSPEHGGWPVSYSTTKVADMPDHPTTKRAWYYELDFATRIS